MREEGRIDRSSHRWSHRWRDAVDAGLPGSSVLSCVSRSPSWRAASRREEEGRWRSGVVPRPCVRAAGRGRRRGGGCLVPCRARLCVRPAAGRGQEEGRRRSGAVPRPCVRAVLQPVGVSAACQASASGGGCSGSQGQGGCRQGRGFLGRDMLFGWAAGETLLAALLGWVYSAFYTQLD
jgi:hypothetical protein